MAVSGLLSPLPQSYTPRKTIADRTWASWLCRAVVRRGCYLAALGSTRRRTAYISADTPARQRLVFALGVLTSLRAGHVVVPVMWCRGRRSRCVDGRRRARPHALVHRALELDGFVPIASSPLGAAGPYHSCAWSPTASGTSCSSVRPLSGPPTRSTAVPGGPSSATYLRGNRGRRLTSVGLRDRTRVRALIHLTHAKARVRRVCPQPAVPVSAVTRFVFARRGLLSFATVG